MYKPKGDEFYEDEAGKLAIDILRLIYMDHSEQINRFLEMFRKDEKFSRTSLTTQIVLLQKILEVNL